MNVFRTLLMQRYKVRSLKLSGKYVFFWDRLERSNFFLDQIIDTAQESVSSRPIETLISKVVDQGGQWDMALDIVERYGIRQTPRDFGIYPWHKASFWRSTYSSALLDTNIGILDSSLFDFNLGLDIELADMNKRHRIETGESYLSHAMVITGADIAENGKTVERWRVQDSHDEESGRGGYFVMANEWFEKYAFVAVVHPTFVTQQVGDVLHEAPIELPLWDPLGSR